jgi:hypothetical protein
MYMLGIAGREYGELCPGRQSAGETRTQAIGSEKDVMAVSESKCGGRARANTGDARRFRFIFVFG